MNADRLSPRQPDSGTFAGLQRAHEAALARLRERVATGLAFVVGETRDRGWTPELLAGFNADGQLVVTVFGGGDVDVVHLRSLIGAKELVVPSRLTDAPTDVLADVLRARGVIEAVYQSATHLPLWQDSPPARQVTVAACCPALLVTVGCTAIVMAGGEDEDEVDTEQDLDVQAWLVGLVPEQATSLDPTTD
jgi:hypothetical protein